MPTQRWSPYLWVTWVIGYLSGESHCEWAGWFKAHFKDFDKPKRSFDLTKWTAEHGAMVTRRAQELRDAGYTVYVEDQNGFTLKGKAAALGGKADIVAILKNEDRPGQGPWPPYDALVVDCKSGKPRDKDVFQVLIYMLALPLAVEHCKGLTLRGELEYQDNCVAIGPERLDGKIKALIGATVERLASEVEPSKVPSAFECRFCDITKTDCKERMEESEAVTANTDLW